LWRLFLAAAELGPPQEVTKAEVPVILGHQLVVPTGTIITVRGERILVAVEMHLKRDPADAPGHAIQRQLRHKSFNTGAGYIREGRLFKGSSASFALR